MTTLEQMNEIWTKAQQLYQIEKDDPDPHLAVCHLLANPYHLWQSMSNDPDDQEFPLWLSYLVSGAIKERE